MLKINEIFYSIQGEGTKTGQPCIFIRLTYCNLRCTYCDTEYAFYEGKDMSIDEIFTEIKKYNCNLVEVTGGEPLMQNESFDLMTQLCNSGYSVMLETGGSLPIMNVDQRVKIILDLKCPSSGMEKKNDYSNIDFIKQSDEIKFVIGNKEDFDWSKEIVKQYNLDSKCIVLFSPVFGRIENRELVDWILKDNLNVRFQTQLHKYIWEPDKKGV
ncbi:MAG: radical SAM protein [Ignavibacteriales bacterium]|nr:radical SAM protein [Ignavibacteriales bacterium]